MSAQGKNGIIAVLSVIGILAALFGGVLVYEHSSNGITCRVYLEEFAVNNGLITGTVRLDVTNTNDFTVAVRNIEAVLSNPANGLEFYHFPDDQSVNGVTLESGTSTSITIHFADIAVDEIPDDSIKVVLSGTVEWDGDTSELAIEQELPISWEFQPIAAAN